MMLRDVVVSLGTAIAVAACAVGDEEPVDGESESDLVADPAVPLKAATFRVSSSAMQPKNATFISHPDFVGANVPFRPMNDLRLALERQVGGKLKNRGEAHVTTIAPPEMSKLVRKLPAREVEAVARRAGVETAALVPICVGMGTSRKDRTFFVVVRSDDLLRVRRAVAAAFVARGGSAADFDPDAFFPHVTLGFTSRDLFDTDGVFKSVASCPNPAGIIAGP